MYGLELVTAPATEPVSVATLKSHLRLNTTDEDTILATYITAAREMFESMTDRSCITTTWKLHMDAFPRVVRLPRAPLQSVTHVKYYDPTDTLVTWDSTKYSVDTKREPGRVVPKVWFPDWKVFPVFPPLSYRVSPKVEIQFVAGWTSSNIPAAVKTAVLLLAANYFENRSPVVTGTIATELPLSVKNIINSYKLGWIGNMNPPQFHERNYGYAVE